MGNFNLSDPQVRFLFSCIDDRCAVILRRIDNLRKMKESIDDELYKAINDGYQEDLRLLHETVLILQD